MKKKEKFYETTFTLMVLSRGKAAPASLERLNYLISEGSYYGILSHVDRVVTEATVRQQIEDEGGDPGIVETM